MVHAQIESKDTASPMLVVGKFLDILFQDGFSISNTQAQQQSEINCQPLYYCPSYSQVDLVCLILNIFSGILRPYQVLHCRATTTEEELDLFLKRVEKHQAHYLMLAVNKLPFRLQEVSKLGNYVNPLIYHCSGFELLNLLLI